MCIFIVMKGGQMMITMDKSLMEIKAVKRLLDTTYWARDRHEEIIKVAMEHSECIAVIEDGLMIGFARLVTDYSTVFWLCDVVVDEEYRGRGVGKRMMAYLKTLPYFEGCKGILATQDAHGLYESYGFVKEPYKFMSKDRGKA